MDDQTLQKLCDNFDYSVNISGDNLNSSPIPNGGATLESLNGGSVKDDGTSDSEDDKNVSHVSRKMEVLSNKVLDLRKANDILRHELEVMRPGCEAFNTLHGLSVSFELLKKEYNEEVQTLKKKYLNECCERKRFYNEAIELKGNIRVFCRCRPLHPSEISNGATSVVEFDPFHSDELQINSSESSKKQFKFDHVFKPEDNQDAIFAQTTPIVTSVLDGYNVCIFAYGQTGTGKTFTMEGTPENRGVNYRTLEKLFSLAGERSKIMKYELSVSMLEVYNEKIRDLLVENSNQPAKKLEIKQSAEGTQEVPGLVEARVYGTDEVWELLKSGGQARAVGSTSANELSSRSHCLLRVTVVGKNLVNGQKTRSHLWLVDLAGSERLSRTEVEGERLKESQFINKSLSALGDVISALASKSTHIPYRNSKLTHMLQSSLGGDCKTLMFVQISPNIADLGETVCSLNFAARVRGVEHGPARKQTDPSEVKYKQLLEKSEKETKKLQDTLQAMQIRLDNRENMLKSAQDKIRDLENQLAEERKTRQKQESKALAAISRETRISSYLSQAQKISTEKKPPLAYRRSPLGQSSGFYAAKPRKSMAPTPLAEKENLAGTSMTKELTVKPRRGSVVPVTQPPQRTNNVLQPRRRASIATFRPEPSLTTLNNSAGCTRNRFSRRSFLPEPKRAWRSRVLSPLKETSVAASSMVGTSLTSKFTESPQFSLKKNLIWSPLKIKARRSIVNKMR